MSDRPPPDIPPEQRWQWEEAARQAREASERRMIQQQLEGSHYTSPPRTGTPTNWKSERKGLAWILLPFILIVAGAVLFSLVEIDWVLLDLFSSVAKGILIVVVVGFCLLMLRMTIKHRNNTIAAVSLVVLLLVTLLLIGAILEGVEW